MRWKRSSPWSGRAGCRPLGYRGPVNAPWLARWVALPVAVLAVSTSGILIRMTTASPLVTATNRLLGAAAILLVVAIATRRRGDSSVRRSNVLLLGLSGLLLGLHFALWTSSLFWTSVASAVLLVDTHPALDALAARVFLGEATSGGVWIGIAATLLGSVVIAGGDLFGSPRALLGDLMAVGASVMITGYLVIGRRLRQEMSTAAYGAAVYGVAGVIVAAMAIGTGHSLLESAEHDAPFWVALVLVPSLMGHTVFNWALRYVPVSIVGVAIVGEPVATTAWAWMLLGEPAAPTALLGGALALGGIVWALRAGQASPRRTRAGHTSSSITLDP